MWRIVWVTTGATRSMPRRRSMSCPGRHQWSSRKGSPRRSHGTGITRRGSVGSRAVRIESEGGAVRRACSRPERRSSWSTTCRPAVVASSGAGLLKWQSPLSLHSRIWTTETFISRAQGRHHTLPSDRPERYPTRLAESLTQSRCLVASSTKVHVPHPPDPKHPLYDDLLAGYAPLIVL